MLSDLQDVQIRWIHRFGTYGSIDTHRPLNDQRLDPRSADVREVLGKQVIEALAPLFLGHAQRQFLAIVKVFHGLDIFHVASLGSLA